MSKKSGSIKAGVIGYGGAFNMGKAHLEGMKKAGMTPSAVCEIDPSRLSVATEDFPGIQTYDTVDAMLKNSDVELVTIITPHNTHAPLGLQCLKAGRHVVTEKPFAITTAECDAMIAAAKKKGVVLSTYHNRHWDGWILRAVEEVKKKGVIGEVFRIDCRFGGYGMPKTWWRSNKNISGGILYDWGVHLLEYALQLVDGDITQVSGFAKHGHWAALAGKEKQPPSWVNAPNEDEAMAVIRMAGGQWITLTISSLASNAKPGMLEITGTKGTYLIEWNDWTLSTPGDDKILLRKGKHPPSEGWKFYQNLADHILRGEPLIITPEWARRPIHIIELAMKSAEKGKALDPKYK